MANKTPQYCGKCGSRLVEDNVSFVTDYDIYTGEPNRAEHRALHCPNPTVKTVKNGFRTVTETVNHPGWTLAPNGEWAQN